MDKIIAWDNLSDNVLANRLLMRDYSDLSLLSYDLLLSVISELPSLNYSSSSSLYSLAGFLTQPSVSLGKFSEPRFFN